jgi:phenylpropionate dioxygenase-like ring-hydroxylating dioxygenase large terminal subunit
MYPLNDSQPYPFEQWWIAAYAGEVGRQLMSRKILGQPVVMYRTEAGEPVALFGLCPHRHYPLVKGSLKGDTLECGYHGFAFGANGRCVRVPCQELVPAPFSARRFPVVERAGLIWIWMGKEASANPELLPDLASLGLGSAEWAVEQQPLVTIRARYQLLIDNLMDLSHVSFVHSTTIPGGEAVIKLPCEITESDSSLLVQRIGRGLPSNPFFRFMFPDYSGQVTQCFDTEYFGPNLLRTGGALRTFSNGAESRRLGTTNYLHGITPETPNSVHYFVMTARDFRISDELIGQTNLKMGTMIQPQDIAVIESIEPELDRFASTRRELSVATDEGAIKVRRRLVSQIRSERESEALTG